MHKKVKYTCDQCEYQATLESNLKRHNEAVHLKVKHPCNQYEYKVTGKSSLKAYIESVHEKVKYSCTLCEHKTSHLAGLYTQILSQFIEKSSTHVINVDKKLLDSLI